MSAAEMECVSLDSVLAYRNAAVVKRYAKDHQASLEEAEEVFRETLKWLYLCAHGMANGFACAMTEEIGKLDEMWHTFLLFTRDYADFCERYFGIFLHHVPLDDDESPMDLEALQEQLERQFTLVCEVLGEDTLRAWHDECRYANPAH